jgi:hypothetical protein
MSIPGAASPLFLATTAGAADAFSVSKSLRFNKADGADLQKTFLSAGNRRTFTHSFWVKRSSAGSQRTIFLATPRAVLTMGGRSPLKMLTHCQSMARRLLLI